MYCILNGQSGDGESKNQIRPIERNLFDMAGLWLIKILTMDNIIVTGGGALVIYRTNYKPTAFINCA